MIQLHGKDLHDVYICSLTYVLQEEIHRTIQTGHKASVCDVSFGLRAHDL